MLTFRQIVYDEYFICWGDCIVLFLCASRAYFRGFILVVLIEASRAVLNGTHYCTVGFVKAQECCVNLINLTANHVSSLQSSFLI